MDNKNQKLFRILLVLLILILFNICLLEYISILKQLFILLLPVLFGFTFAFILHPFVKVLRNKFNHKIAVFLVFTLFLILMISIFGFVLPVVFKEMVKFFEQIPNIVENFDVGSNKFIGKVLDFIQKHIDIDKMLEDKLMRLEEVGVNFIKSFFSIILIFVLSVIITAYILVDFDNIVAWLKNKTSEEKYKKLRICLIRMKELMYSYFTGVLLVLMFMFVASSLSFRIIGLEYYIVMGLLFAICNVIPYVGPYIGGAFAVISGLMISYKVSILALMIVVGLQLFENYILTPKIQSKKLKIKPFYLLLTVIIMGKLLGIIGMLISIPILSLFQTIFDIFVLKKEAFVIQ